MKIENFLESTYLKTPKEAEISEDQNEQVIISLIEEAIKYKFKLVMIRPDYIDIGNRIIFNKSSSLLLGTVVDFPNGTSSSIDKLKEGSIALDLGADEIDYVVDYNAFQNRDFNKFDKDILLSTQLCKEKDKVIKWIIETGALSSKEIKEMTSRIRNLVMKEFPNFATNVFIKTSSGYHPGGGANVDDIRIIKSECGVLRIKASGGISNFIQFKNMIDAGATRIGTSNALKILTKN